MEKKEKPKKFLTMNELIQRDRIHKKLQKWYDLPANQIYSLI